MSVVVAGSGYSINSPPAGFGSRAGMSVPHDGPHHGHNVGRFGHRGRALLEQAIGAFGARIERRARHGKHFAALFEGKSRGD